MVVASGSTQCLERALSFIWSCLSAPRSAWVTYEEMHSRSGAPSTASMCGLWVRFGCKMQSRETSLFIDLQGTTVDRQTLAHWRDRHVDLLQSRARIACGVRNLYASCTGLQDHRRAQHDASEMSSRVPKALV